jgi:Tfp pilus assembly protein PilX
MRPFVPFPPRQRGASLVVSLIMLVVLILLVVSAIRMTNTNMKTIGNMQSNNEAIAAAQQAIDQVVSDLNNFYVPAPKTIAIDIDRDGDTDYTVNTSAPGCIKMVPAEGYSIEFAESAPKDTYWDIQAVVTDNRTGAAVTMHQGVKVRLDSSAVCP